MLFKYIFLNDDDDGHSHDYDDLEQNPCSTRCYTLVYVKYPCVITVVPNPSQFIMW